MITGVHAMFYSSQPESLRGFLRDSLGLTSTDVGGGWLIFDIPDAEIGVHPADFDAGAPSGKHHISFYCDDIHKTVADLKSKYVSFDGDIQDMGYGLVTSFRMPGDFLVQLYQPKYQRAASAKPVAAAAQSKPAKAKPAAAKKPAPKPVAKKKPAPKPAPKAVAKKKPMAKGKAKKR